DPFKRIASDWKTFTQKTSEEWGQVKGQDWKAKGAMIGCKVLEIITKPFIKLVEYPVAWVFGALGGLVTGNAKFGDAKHPIMVNGQEKTEYTGKEWCQSVATDIGDLL